MRHAVVLLTVILTGILTTAARADPLGAGATQLVGAAAGGAFAPLPTPVEFAAPGSSSVSADGRYIAFYGSSTGLVPGTDDRVSSVYVKDKDTGSVELVSRETGGDGAPNDADCFVPSVSDDGDRIVFACDGALDEADTNGKTDVYLRDRSANTTTLVSRTASEIGTGTSSYPDISGNGLYAAFISTSALAPSSVTLVGNRIYRRALDSGGVVLIDPAANPAQAPNGESSDPSISADGSRVAYESFASNLAPGVTDANSGTDVYLRNVGGGSTALVSSRGDDGATAANGSSFDPQISGNGTYVAFTSQGSTFGDGDSDTANDVHRRNVNVGPTPSFVLVNRSSSNVKSNAQASLGGINFEGDVVSFTTTATNLVTPELPAGSAQQAYRRTIPTGITSLVSRETGPTGAIATRDAFAAGISGDGTVVPIVGRGLTPDADPTVSQVFARKDQTTTYVSRPAGTDRFANDGGDAILTGAGALSADGRYALFVSAAPALSPTPGQDQLFRRDNVTGAVVLVSRGDGAGGPPVSTGQIGDATISADGNRVAFSAVGDGFGAGLPAGTYAVYVRDVAAATTELAARADGAAGPPLGASFAPSISADGRRVAFSVAPAQLYVRDLAAGTTTLLPATPGSPSQPSLDADGGRVAWTTRVPDPNQGNYPVDGHVYVADVGAAAATQLDTGARDDQQPQDATISGDGARVAFDSPAQLVATDTDAFADVYVVDVTADTRTLASGGTGSSFAPQISQDGRRVAYLSTATDLVAGDTDGHTDAFVSDLASGTTILASRGNGVSGPLPSQQDIHRVAVNATGDCVVFSTGDAGLAPGLDPDVSRVWLRAATGPCPVPAPVAIASPSPSPSPSPTATPTVTVKKRPVASRFTAKPKRFRTRGKKRGTRFSWTLDRAASVRIDVARLLRGHRNGNVCRQGKPKRKQRKCTREKRVATIRLAGVKGANHVRFRRKGLAVGRYKAVLTATASGGTSKPVSVRLRVRR